MHYGLVQTVAPALEPVTLAEMKAYLGIPSATTVDDGMLAGFIVAAREAAETFTGRQLAAATFVLSLDWLPGYTAPGMSYYPYGDFYSSDRGWDEKRSIRLPKPPLVSVSTLQYLDTTGALQTLAANLYTVDTQSQLARLAPAYGQIWPVTRATQNAATVTYVAGYVQTTVTSNIAAGANQVVTPTNMAGVVVGAQLRVDVGASMEVVNVSNVTATTFTATFASAHNGSSGSPLVCSTIPEGIKVAIKFFVATRYENRWTDQTMATFENLLTPYWAGEYGT